MGWDPVNGLSEDSHVCQGKYRNRISPYPRDRSIAFLTHREIEMCLLSLDALNAESPGYGQRTAIACTLYTRPVVGEATLTINVAISSVVSALVSPLSMHSEYQVQ
jgi:hypothetical protein